MKITGVEVFTINLRDAEKKGLVKSFTLLRGPQEFLFIKLITDEGIIGYGETSELPFALPTGALLIKEIVNEVILPIHPMPARVATVFCGRSVLPEL